MSTLLTWREEASRMRTTHTPRLFFWVVADNTPQYHELSASTFEQSYLVLLAHVDKGPYLFGHSDDSLDGKVRQVYHTHQVVRILLGRGLLLKREVLDYPDKISLKLFCMDL